MPSMAFTKYSHFHVIGKLLFILIAKFLKVAKICTHENK